MAVDSKRKEKFLVLDGGVATELTRAGFNLDVSQSHSNSAACLCDLVRQYGNEFVILTDPAHHRCKHIFNHCFYLG